MGWFSKLRKDGAVASGSGTIEVNGAPVTPGHEPYWFNDTTLVYKGPGDLPTKFDLTEGKATPLSNTPSSMTAAGGGVWQTLDGEKIWVSVSREGQRVWVIEHGGQNRDRSIFLNGFPIIEHTIVNFAMVQNDYVVWSRFEPREIWGRKSHGTPEKLTDGLFAVPVKTPWGMWVVAQTHTTYKVFDWETKLGYVIEVGNDENLNHDALFINGKIQIVANNGRGELRPTTVDLSQPRIPIDIVQPKPEEPKPEEPKPEEPAMSLPVEVKKTINAMWPLVKHLHAGTDDNRREGTKMIAEQVRFEHGPQWGTKSSSPNNPQSKDAIAWMVGNKLFSMDMINGATRDLSIDGHMEDITGQHFIAVNPVNYLANPEPKPEEPKPTDPKPEPVCDCAKVKAEMIAAMVDLSAKMMQAMDDKIKALPKAEAPRLKAVVEVDPSSSSLWGKHSHGVRVKIVPEE